MVIGIIGGSGLYNFEGVSISEERSIETPFGNPSDKVLMGELSGVPFAFLSRHGRGHRCSPTEVNYHANIYALKTLGVDKLIGVSAVGSMKEELGRGHIVFADQLIDRTRERPYSFFEKGIVAHVAFAEPFCASLRGVLFTAGKKAGANVHNGGTYVCIEGPAFSTRAESFLYRSWGADIVGMTCYQEARLAREAEICYAVMALVTDYDCWHEEEEDVDVSAIIAVIKKNAGIAQDILRFSIPEIAKMKGCPCHSALKNAIMTAPDAIPPEAKKRLRPIIGKYIK